MSSYGNVILFDTPNKIASKDMDALIYMTATTAYIAPVGSALTVFGIAFLMMFARRGPVQRTQQNI